MPTTNTNKNTAQGGRMKVSSQPRFHPWHQGGRDWLRTIVFVAAILFAPSACAQSPTTPATSNTSSNAPDSSLALKWLGKYEPLSRDGIRMKNILEVNKSTFSWMDCNEVNIQPILVSLTELSFEVDPTAKCGWAGWIVALTTSSPESLAAIRVNAYRGLQQYQAKGYGASFPYSKISD